MKKFAGTKPWRVIKAQCKAAGVAIDDYSYRELGSDYIYLGRATTRRIDGSPGVSPGHVRGCAYVAFNTATGTFFGKTHTGIVFSSSGTEYEGRAWFQALLRFFYVEK